MLTAGDLGALPLRSRHVAHHCLDSRTPRPGARPGARPAAGQGPLDEAELALLDAYWADRELPGPACFRNHENDADPAVADVSLEVTDVGKRDPERQSSVYRIACRKRLSTAITSDATVAASRMRDQAPVPIGAVWNRSFRAGT